VAMRNFQDCHGQKIRHFVRYQTSVSHVGICFFVHLPLYTRSTTTTGLSPCHHTYISAQQLRANSHSPDTASRPESSSTRPYQLAQISPHSPRKIEFRSPNPFTPRSSLGQTRATSLGDLRTPLPHYLTATGGSGRQVLRHRISTDATAILGKSCLLNPFPQLPRLTLLPPNIT
jgi:hypothetical protein